ncbi:Maf family protein [Thalassotalea ganghwensis]
MKPSLVLASQSPRRAELLRQLGYEFHCLVADIDETPLTQESPVDYVKRVALAKAEAVAKLRPSSDVVLGSDTAVVYQHHILGKPKDFQDSLQMLTLLSGNTHQVFTAIAVIGNGDSQTELITTDVTFKRLSEQEIANYWHTGEPQDKAGSYGIQGIGGQFVTEIKGSYSAVVGLPLYETARLLAQFNWPTPVQASGI